MIILKSLGIIVSEPERKFKLDIVDVKIVSIVVLFIMVNPDVLQGTTATTNAASIENAFFDCLDLVIDTSDINAGMDIVGITGRI